MNAPVTFTLASIVDRLAQVKQQIADLQIEERHLKDVLIDTTKPVIEGFYHRAAVSRTAGRIITDWKAIAEHFEPSRQMITAHSQKTADVVTVRVSSRKVS